MEDRATKEKKAQVLKVNGSLLLVFADETRAKAEIAAC